MESGVYSSLQDAECLTISDTSINDCRPMSVTHIVLSNSTIVSVDDNSATCVFGSNDLDEEYYQLDEQVESNTFINIYKKTGAVTTPRRKAKSTIITFNNYETERGCKYIVERTIEKIRKSYRRRAKSTTMAGQYDQGRNNFRNPHPERKSRGTNTKRKRGRPLKSTILTIEDYDDEDVIDETNVPEDDATEAKPKRKRGRPRKEQGDVEIDVDVQYLYVCLSFTSLQSSTSALNIIKRNYNQLPVYESKQPRIKRKRMYCGQQQKDAPPAKKPRK